MLLKAALLCGFVALPLFVATDVISGSSWKGYSFVMQSVGDLSAVGAPTRSFAAPLFALQNLLVIAFGIAVWVLSDRNLALRVTAALVITNGVAGLAAAFFPAQAGVRPTFFTPGVILGAVGVFSLVVAMVFGAVAFGNWFRFYSIATLAAFTLLTIFGLTVQTTARIGLQERVMGYGSLLWVAALAIVLLIAQQPVGNDPQTG